LFRAAEPLAVTDSTACKTPVVDIVVSEEAEEALFLPAASNLLLASE
tara:strand:- start:19 stop:159 length:141 start_codon:yes stop_codon:yes gene_type:complete